MVYSYGIPGWVIWLSHLINGLLLAYVGYEISQGHKLHKGYGYYLGAIAVFMILYHGSLWYKHLTKITPIVQ